MKQIEVSSIKKVQAYILKKSFIICCQSYLHIDNTNKNELCQQQFTVYGDTFKDLLLFT